MASQISPKDLFQVRILTALPQAVSEREMLVACPIYTLVVPTMHYVYILQSLKDNGLYIGSTNNLRRRFTEHQNGKSLATKGRLPVKLIHYQGFVSERDAIDTEKYFKTTRGWERIHRMLKDTLGKLQA